LYKYKGRRKERRDILQKKREKRYFTKEIREKMFTRKKKERKSWGYVGRVINKRRTF
jgi:hypothetical protein